MPSKGRTNRGTLPSVRPPSGAALLLSQLGAHVSRRFAERLAPLDLSPAHVAVLRVVGQNPGIGQRELAEELGVVPSRVVVLIDELEERGIVERRRDDIARMKAYRLSPSIP